MDWKIFYSDQVYYGKPELAPKRDVQAIVVFDKLTGHRVERQENQYIWTPKNGGWRGVDEFGLFDYMIEPGYKIVLYGRTLNDNEYKEVWDRVRNDVDIPRKSAYSPHERRP